MADNSSARCIHFPDVGTKEHIYLTTTGSYDDHPQIVKTAEVFFRLNANVPDGQHGVAWGMICVGHGAADPYAWINIRVLNGYIYVYYIGSVVGEGEGGQSYEYASASRVMARSFTSTPISYESWYHLVLRVDNASDALDFYLADLSKNPSFPGGYEAETYPPRNIATSIIGLAVPPRPQGASSFAYQCIGHRFAISGSTPIPLSGLYRAALDLSEIRLWSEERSDANLNSYNGAVVTGQSNLIHYWSLNEIDGATYLQDRPDGAIVQVPYHFSLSSSECLVGRGYHPFLSSGGTTDEMEDALTASQFSIQTAGGIQMPQLVPYGFSGFLIESTPSVVLQDPSGFNIAAQSSDALSSSEFKIQTVPTEALGGSEFRVSNPDSQMAMGDSAFYVMVPTTDALEPSGFKITSSPSDALGSSAFMVGVPTEVDTDASGFSIAAQYIDYLSSSAFAVEAGTSISLIGDGGSGFAIYGQGETSGASTLGTSEFKITAQDSTPLKASEFSVVSASSTDLGASGFNVVVSTQQSDDQGAAFAVMAQSSESMTAGFKIAGQVDTSSLTVTSGFAVFNVEREVEDLSKYIRKLWRDR